jgi:uncharacterized protein (DUF58 family)
VGAASFDEKIRYQVPVRSKRNHLNAVIEAFGSQSQVEKTDMRSVLRQIAETYPRRGMMVLFSDLLTDVKQLLKGLRMMRQLGHDVMVFHIMDDDELDFPFDGPTRFEGLESIDALNCNPRALREGYLEAVGAFLEEVRRGCVGSTIDYALVRTSEPLDAVLAKYLTSRLGMHQRN